MSFTAEVDDARALLAAKGEPVSEHPRPFGLNPEQLMALIDPKSPAVLSAVGGAAGLEKVLVTNTHTGLVDAQLGAAELDQRTAVYGRNVIREKKQQGLFKIMLMTLDDKVLIILIVAALISLALGLYETFGEPPEYDADGHKMPKVDWVEGVAILVAVAIVTVVGSVNDWQKERQFVKLNKKKEQRLIEVMRNGSQQQVGIEDVVVGDIVFVQPGDVLAVDGVVLASNDIECDESSVTGESDTVTKVPATEVEAHFNPKKMDCFMISGAKVLQGTGRYMVTAVGENSMWGRTMLSLHEGTEVTPLQEKLNRIADGIAKFGVWSALILFIVLFIRFCVEISGNGRYADLQSSQKGNHFMDIFIVSVTIVVVAVPEGLPLAVTLALAFATTRMVKDNCLVRVLKSCETMGGATTVCSDKTGTLTQNVMTVVRSTIGRQQWTLPVKSGEDAEEEVELALQGDQTSLSVEETGGKMPESERLLLQDSICLNSTIYEDHTNPVELIGSKTEMALVNYSRTQLGVQVGSLQSYRESRPVVYVLPFDSARKYMLTIVEIENGFRLLIKGAAEIVMNHAATVIGGDHEIVKFDENARKFMTDNIDNYADAALRCIAVAYKDFHIHEKVDWATVRPDDIDVSELTFIGLFGIQDPLRPGVREAVMQCQRAGVAVRMVTGDNLRTARAIAANANIVSGDPNEDIVVMEGPAFRELSDEELEKIVPRLRVLARSSPQDKRRLVEFLKSQGETVAVTGDGTNDAPALRLADVGFSMGMSGTEVAKEASDIIIMDDNFASIVNALKWGRTVNDAVKKFLQFQLTVNVTAVALTFVSAVASSDNTSVLTAVQLLWVNLIMDTLAALALATDAPTDAVLDRPPDNRKVSLITPTMWKMIFGQAAYQLGVTFVLHFAGKQLFGYDHKPNFSGYDQEKLGAMVFNAFVWMQFFNMFVNRRLDNKQNLLVGLTRNPFFPLIVAIIGGFQVLIMFVGGAAFSIKRNSGAMWATALICGFVSIPMGMALRLVPDAWVMKLFPRRLWHWFMFCLDGLENAFLWCMTPVTWTYDMIVLGFKKLFRIQTKAGDDENNGMVENHQVERHIDSKPAATRSCAADTQPLVDSHYKWMPGIEQSIADLSFLQKVRGGRSRQLKFKRVTQPIVMRRRESADRRSMFSRGSNASTLAAFMAPFVVSGAVGGWMPLPRDGDPPPDGSQEDTAHELETVATAHED